MEIRTGTAASRVGGDKAGEPGGLEIYYEDMGNPDDPAVLLIMGLGAQLLLWRSGFCQKLVDQGLRVIRFDNRDVGLSSKLHGRKAGGSQPVKMARSLLGLRSPAVYTLEDMAADAIAVLDHLQIERSHVVGASMGGMIAQIIAARHAPRTQTLGILFSSNNQPLLPPPGPRQLFAVIKGPSPDSPRDVIVENGIRVSRIIGSPRYPTPDEQVLAETVEAYERAHYPVGIARHFDAIMGTGSLLRYDRTIAAPTVIIHGKADKLMRPSGGRAIAAAIPGARLVLYDGMGHNLPEQLWDHIIGELKTTFAEGARA